MNLNSPPPAPGSMKATPLAMQYSIAAQQQARSW